MSSFEEREKSFENKFVFDEDLKFKIKMRRNKLLGLWAAQYLAKTEEEAEEYAQELIKNEYIKAGSLGVIAKIEADLSGKVSRLLIENKVSEFFDAAKTEMLEGNE